MFEKNLQVAELLEIIPRDAWLKIFNVEEIVEAIGLDIASDKIALTDAKGATRSNVQLPSRLWNEMVNPFAPMAMRGMIWYQGCSNSGDVPVERYARMMHALYNGWSKKFENPSLKLYFVQLAPWGGGCHPEFQQVQQRFAEAEPNAAMAVINDLGNLTDIHPCDKETVARRLAVHALKRDYGFTAIEDESPKLRSWRIEGDRFVMTFDHAKSFYIYNKQFIFFNIIFSKYIKQQILSLC